VYWKRILLKKKYKEVEEEETDGRNYCITLRQQKDIRR
jgi:hypothetical protein